MRQNTRMNIRRPNETLDDFQSRVTAPVDPPSAVLLYPTGDIETLEPLAGSEDFMNGETVTGTFVTVAPRPFSWFHRTLAVGAALAIIAFLSAGLLIRLYRPAVEPVGPVDVASDRPADISAPSDESDNPDLFSPMNSPFAFDGSSVTRKTAKPRRASSRASRNVYQPQRSVPNPQITALLQRPQLIVSGFVPTTLIIYIENGEIKTRVEPQLTAAYKRSLPPGN